MKMSQICKHCGRYRQYHSRVYLNSDEAEEVLKGFKISLNECLMGGYGFEPMESKPENQPTEKPDQE